VSHNAKKTGLAVVGDFYHPAAPLREMVGRAAQDFDWSFEPDPRRVDWARLDGASLLFLSVEDRVAPGTSEERWMGEEAERAVEAYVLGGGGLLVHHSALASYPEGGRFRALMGGGFLFHPSRQVEFTVSAVAEHPIVAGLEPFAMTDELYIVDRDPDTTILALASSGRVGSSSAAWCAQRGRGRVACVAPGHTPANLALPGLVALVGQAARWCARLM
jgi:type 1 glutamine amidotransferase